MSRLGMSPGVVSELQGVFASGARDVERVRERLRAVDGELWWAGADRMAWGDDLDEADALLMEMAGRLRSAGETLAHQVREQESAAGLSTLVGGPTTSLSRRRNDPVTRATMRPPGIYRTGEAPAPPEGYDETIDRLKSALGYSDDEVKDLLRYAAQYAKQFEVDVIDLIMIIMREAEGFPGEGMQELIEDMGLTKSHGPSNIQWPVFQDATTDKGLDSLFEAESRKSKWDDLWDKHHMEVMVAATASHLNTLRQHAQDAYFSGGAMQDTTGTFDASDYAIMQYNVGVRQADGAMEEWSGRPGEIMKRYHGEITEDRDEVKAALCGWVYDCESS